MEECHALGLFQTRLPRFSQLFFHNFSQSEEALRFGQSLTHSVSRRAAISYLKSGVRLESKCGISDVWFEYVEAHRGIFESLDPPSSFTPPPPGPHPRLEPTHALPLSDTFPWLDQHTNPCKKPSLYLEAGDELSQCSENISEFTMDEDVDLNGLWLEAGEEEEVSSDIQEEDVRCLDEGPVVLPELDINSDGK